MRVLVTGAASGIGAAIAASLSSAGHEVIGVDRTAGDGILAADVGDAARWDEVVDGAGPVDALVNCAGVRLRTPLTELGLDEWNDVLRINLTGSFLGIQAVSRRWIAAGTAGSVLNIASTTSFGAVSGQVHYCVSKAGVAMLTKAAALELAPHGIRVNAIAPGPIVTPMLQTRLDEPGQAEWLTGQVPLGRLGSTDDVAGAARYLLGADAGFVTGVVLPVDGGWLTR
ncbi:MAG: SDR family oxidoreductase [Actinobacteria bacterium]|nr:SDR family oxidoreductase [Actinomycetota bacterium]